MNNQWNTIIPPKRPMNVVDNRTTRKDNKKYQTTKLFTTKTRCL